MDLYQNALAKNYVLYEKISFLINFISIFHFVMLMSQEMVEGIVAVNGDKPF